jgi:hypothetical protein
MEPQRMFQDILFTENHGTFQDTPRNKMKRLGAEPSK